MLRSNRANTSSSAQIQVRLLHFVLFVFVFFYFFFSLPPALLVLQSIRYIDYTICWLLLLLSSSSSTVVAISFLLHIQRFECSYRLFNFSYEFCSSLSVVVPFHLACAGHTSYRTCLCVLCMFERECVSVKQSFLFVRYTGAENFFFIQIHCIS